MGDTSQRRRNPGNGFQGARPVIVPDREPGNGVRLCIAVKRRASQPESTGCWKWSGYCSSNRYPGAGTSGENQVTVGAANTMHVTFTCDLADRCARIIDAHSSSHGMFGHLVISCSGTTYRTGIVVCQPQTFRTVNIPAYEQGHTWRGILRKAGQNTGEERVFCHISPVPADAILSDWYTCRRHRHCLVISPVSFHSHHMEIE